MKEKKDELIIQQIKQGFMVNENLKELIRRHSGIFISVVNGICHRKDCVEIKDIIQEKDFYIYRAALKFDENKGVKFCTFLGNEARWLTLDTLNAVKKQARKRKMQTDENFHPPGKSRKATAEETLKKAWDLAKSSEDKRVEKIFKLRYIDGNGNKVMPWKKIAKKLDLSIQGCINIHNGFIENIKRDIYM